MQAVNFVNSERERAPEQKGPRTGIEGSQSVLSTLSGNRTCEMKRMIFYVKRSDPYDFISGLYHCHVVNQGQARVAAR